MSVWGQGRTILSRVVRESLREIVALEWADLEEVREQSLTWAGLGKGGVAGRVPEGTAKATPPPPCWVCLVGKNQQDQCGWSRVRDLESIVD